MHESVAIDNAAPLRGFVSGAGLRSFSLTRAAWPLFVAAGTMVATAYVATHNPHVSGALPVCSLYATTGLYCPGCGATRAVYDLAHGHFASAFSMNPLFVLAVPLLGVLWLRWFVRGQGMRLKDWPFPTAAGWILPGIIVLFTILRNTPTFAPYLAP